MAPRSIRDEPGLITTRENAITRGTVSLYDGYEAGFDVHTRWVTFCSEHGTLAMETNKQRATKMLRTPEGWCRGCAQRLEAARAPARPMRTVEDGERSPEGLEREMRFWAMKAKGNPEKCKLFEIMYGVSPDGYWD